LFKVAKQVIDGSGVGESGRKLEKRFDVDTTVIGKILKNKDGILNEYVQNIYPDRKRSLHSIKHSTLTSSKQAMVIK
jgi:hypothetical protein